MLQGESDSCLQIKIKFVLFFVLKGLFTEIIFDAVSLAIF